LTTGDNNTAVGRLALYAVNGGAGNNALGKEAGDSLTTGSYNQLIGHNANASAVDAQYQIVIGHDISGGEDSQFTFGRSSNLVQNEFDTDAAWTRTSDIRKKRNVQDDKLGLSFINNLRSVTFQWKPSNEFPEEWSEYSQTNNMDLETVMHGLIAQEVKEALDKEGVDTFGGWKEREDGSQVVSREMFVTPLIKAVQELSNQVTALQAEVTKLKGE